MRQLSRSMGFTLIELVIVAAILGILSMIAIPKFANMIMRAQEAAVLGKLGAMRSALNIYVADNDGAWPGPEFAYINGVWLGSYVPGGVLGRYIDEFPEVRLPRVRSLIDNAEHRGRYFKSPDGNIIVDGVDTWAPRVGPRRALDAYFSTGVSASLEAAWAISPSEIWVNCRHTDSKGVPWTSY